MITKIIKFVFVIFCVTGIASKSDGKISLKNFAQDEKRFYGSYLSGDIENAEYVLNKFHEKVIEYERAGIKGLNFKSIYRGIYAMFYLIEKQKGNENAANRYLNTYFLKYNKEKISKNEISRRQRAIVQFYGEMDFRNSAAWMKVQLNFFEMKIKRNSIGLLRSTKWK